MSILPSTEGENGGMRAVVEYNGLAPERSADVPAEHQPYIDKVLAMHPFDDVPGNVSDGSNLPNQPALSIEALSPEMRDEVSRRLARHPLKDQDRLKAKYVEEVVKAKLPSIRAMTGVRKDALPFHREQALIASQVADLEHKRDFLQSELDRVRSYGTKTDEQTGKAVPIENMAITGQKRKAFGEQVAELDRQIRLLVSPDGSYGIEGHKRVDKSLRESAAVLFQRDQAREEEAEAKRRAADAEREERINRRADALKTMRTGKR